jgi:hypothetical protein
VLAVESIPYRLRVNPVGAGDVVTNLLNHFMPNGRDFLARPGKHPVGRAAQLEEIAAFLASDRAISERPVNHPIHLGVEHSPDVT